MIIFSKKDNIGLLKLNRPEKRNALNPELITGIKEHLLIAEKDEEIKVLIITGEGKVFSAGADLSYLKNLQKFSSAENESDSESIAGLFLQLYKFPKPTIAAVQGPAIAGGCGLSAVCDFIVADELNARFGYTEVKIGFLPAIVSLFLIKRIGEGIAKQLLLSGEIIDAKEAYRLGLANYITNDTLKRSYELAEQLKNNSSYSMYITKKMINTISGLSVDEAVEYCIKLNVISRSSADFNKGLNNFLTKK